jgi:ABC-type branched-subunit amino acid transport system ATPase component
MPPVIQVSGVRETDGATVAVDEVSFEVNEGEIFGLIDPNGAGKTRVLKLNADTGLQLVDRAEGVRPRGPYPVCVL